MPRHYTDAEKQLVLDRLIANHGDVPRTVEEMGVPMRTLYNWQKDANLPLPNLLPNLPNSPPSLAGAGAGVGVSALPPQTTEAFQTLHDTLLTLANTLSHRIEEAIDEAPLNQRVAALAQLIDRIAKLATLLPQDDDEVEQEIQYVYEYEVEHHVEKKKESTEENNSHPYPQTEG